MPEPEQFDEQLKFIAKMLVKARAPLIYGLTQLTLEAQELAVELAMCLRGAIDTPRGSQIPSRGTSLQLQGETRTTLGELRQYADLLVYVDCEPTDELLAVCAVHGSSKRSIKQHYLKPAAGSSLVNQIREFGCRNMDDVHAIRKKQSRNSTSDVAHEQLLELWQRANYPVLIYHPAKLVQTFGKLAAAYLGEAIERAALGRAKHGRAAAWPLPDGEALSSAAGAEYVLTARTGYPAAVQFFSGYAEFLPGVTDAEALLADGIIDAALFLGEGPSNEWAAEAKHRIQKIPTAIIAAAEFLNQQACEHQIACSPLSEEQGTIVREDGLPIPLNVLSPKAVPGVAQEQSFLSAQLLLSRLLELIREPATTTSGAAR
jgi:formylmethanofuran dehydrogenase subunit B